MRISSTTVSGMAVVFSNILTFLFGRWDLEADHTSMGRLSRSQLSMRYNGMKRQR